MKNRILNKKIILIIILLSNIISLSFSIDDYDSYSSEEKMIEYLKRNISTLDPIEGAYDVILRDEVLRKNGIWVKGENEPWGIWYIIRETPNNFLCGTWVRDGNFFNPIFIIERLGDTNLYNIDYIEDIKDGEVVVSMRGKLSNDIINGFSTYTIGPKERWWVRFDKKYPAKEDYLLASGTENKALNPKQWGGTGFSLGKRYVVTNYHVIENASSIKITGVNGSFYTDYEAKVIATDRSNDLALLQITDLRCPSINSLPYKIKTQQANVGESVFVLGYPLTSTMGEEIKLTTGVVSSRSGFQGDVSLYQISAPIQPETVADHCLIMKVISSELYVLNTMMRKM